MENDDQLELERLDRIIAGQVSPAPEPERVLAAYVERAELIAERDGERRAIPLMQDAAGRFEKTARADHPYLAWGWLFVRRWLATRDLPGVDRDEQMGKLAGLVESHFDALAAGDFTTLAYAVRDVAMWHLAHERQAAAVDLGARVEQAVDELQPPHGEGLLALAVLPALCAAYELAQDAVVLRVSQRAIDALKDADERAFDDSLANSYAIVLSMRAVVLAPSQPTASRALWQLLVLEFADDTRHRYRRAGRQRPRESGRPHPIGGSNPHQPVVRAARVASLRRAPLVP